MVDSVNRVYYDTDFAEDAYDEMPYDQQLKTNYMKLLMAFVDRLDIAQTQIIDLAYLRFLDNASGDMLDYIASRFFIERGTMDDDSIRGAIKLHALKQDSEATRADIYNLLQILAGDGGYVSIYKGKQGYVETCLSTDCIDLSALTADLGEIFPIDTNLKFLSVRAGHNPFSLSSEYDIEVADNVGVLGSNYDGYFTTQSTAVTIIADEVLGYE